MGWKGIIRERLESTLKNMLMYRKIHVVLTSDANYILQTRIAIWSMLKASHTDYMYVVHVLCSRQLESSDRNKIYDLKKYFDNIEIDFIEIDEKKFEKTLITSYYTVASYYRLIMPEVIHADKCIFLDGDTIVRTDFSKLYEINIDEYYVAGVLDCVMQSKRGEFEEHRKIIDLPTLDNYINGGLLVCNLRKMREDNLYAEFLDYIDKGFPFMDNDVINKCCYGKIKFLNLKYNFFVEFYGNTCELKGKNFTNQEVESLDKNDMLFHFPGRYKPWDYVRTKASDTWWNTAKEALPENEYKNLYNSACMLAMQNDWSNLVRICKKQKDIVIVGYSDIGRDLADSLLRSGIKRIRCFCDNNIEKQGMDYRDIVVSSITIANQRYPDSLWIVSSQNYYKQIMEQLREMEIDKRKIIRYIDKNESYYKMIDEKYKANEDMQAGLKEHGMVEEI